MKWSHLPHRLRAGRQALAAAGVLTLLTAGAGILVPPVAEASTGTTYYVSTSGSDSNAGTSTASAWRSLAKVDATTFQPGDRILFQSGDSWKGLLWPKGSGVSGSPITIGRYGSGAKPSFAGAGTVSSTVKLWNQQYWTVSDIDVSNNAPSAGTAGANLGDFRGIHIGGDNSRTLSGFVIDRVDVHDVTGVDNWVGGHTSNNNTTNQIVQYNYLHNNNVGILAFQIKFGGNSIWRYNVIANNSKEALQLGSVSSSTAQIYNNTIYNTASTQAWLMTPSHYTFTNNIFYTTVANPTMATGTAIVYNNNLYGGNSPSLG